MSLKTIVVNQEEWDLLKILMAERKGSISGFIRDKIHDELVKAGKIQKDFFEEKGEF